jgi:FkbM family methyltransferase
MGSRGGGVMGLKKMMRKIKMRRDIDKVLLEAAPLLSVGVSLDVTKMYGYYVFHNKGNSLVARKSYEPDVQNALKTLIGLDSLRNHETVFADIGANIGLHSLYLKSLYPQMLIVAFDPSPYSWTYMELSIKYNTIDNVRIVKTALSDMTGTIEMFNWGEESSADSLRNTGRVNGVIPNMVRVPVTRLDDIDDSSRFSVIKMDCEGAELSILRGAKKLLSNNKPLVILEFNKDNMKSFEVDTSQIESLLSEVGYSLYSLDFIKLNHEKFEESLHKNIENYILLPNGLVNKI